MVEHEGPGNTTIVGGRGWSPNPMPPRYRDPDEPLQPPYRGDGAIARGVYPPGPQTPPYGGAGAIARGAYPPGPQMPPYRSDGPTARGAYPPGPQMPPYRGDGAVARGDYSPGPQIPPYYNADPYVDGPGRRRGDNSQMATRGPYPANRPPAPRLDVQASIDPTLGPRVSYRPPATAKSNSKCPTCSPNRASDELPTRRVSASETAQSPPPTPSPPATAPSQPEQQQSATGYKVLPRSYWAGASWRWRLKVEHDMTVVASSRPDPQ